MKIHNYHILSTSKNNAMPAVHSVNWPVQNVLAFTTTRFPPLELNTHTNAILPSTPPSAETYTELAYSSFNLGLHVGDNPSKVHENRNRLLKFLQQKKCSAALGQLSSDELASTGSNINIQWFEQVHGADVVEVNKYQPISITADAAITRNKHIALAIMTADCLPILLAANDGSEVAAIHGGWRPLSNSIIANTVNKMNTQSDQICAWLGPCIGAESFQVGPEVREHFIQNSVLFTEAFKMVTNCGAEGTGEEKEIRQANNPSKKYLADLHMIARIQLAELGIRNISVLAHCTYQRPGEYYSYRRESTTGRMATLICCN